MEHGDFDSAKHSPPRAPLSVSLDSDEIYAVRQVSTTSKHSTPKKGSDVSPRGNNNNNNNLGILLLGPDIMQHSHDVASFSGSRGLHGFYTSHSRAPFKMNTVSMELAVSQDLRKHALQLQTQRLAASENVQASHDSSWFQLPSRPSSSTQTRAPGWGRMRYSQSLTSRALQQQHLQRQPTPMVFDGNGKARICKSKPAYRRLLSRNGGYYRVSHHSWSSMRLMLADIYHHALHMHLSIMLLMSMAVYLLFYSFFGFLWWSIADECEIDVYSFRDGLYLSVQTGMTIGYAAKDPFFSACFRGAPVLVTQALASLLLDCVLLNTFCQKILSAKQQASSIVFSDVAVLRVEGDRVRLEFRLCDSRDRPLLECRARLTMVYNESTVGTLGAQPWGAEDRTEVRVAGMKITEPIDADQIFISLPTVVVHEVDCNSPLAMPGRTGNPTLAEVHERIKSFPFLEIIATVAGTDEISGNGVEARVSWTYTELLFQMRFIPCLYLDKNGHHCVDFEALHLTIEADEDCASELTENFHVASGMSAGTGHGSDPYTDRRRKFSDGLVPGQEAMLQTGSLKSGVWPDALTTLHEVQESRSQLLRPVDSEIGPAETDWSEGPFDEQAFDAELFEV